MTPVVTLEEVGVQVDQAGSLAVTPSLVGDQVYEAIEGAILSGELPSGSRLRVRQLADMVGTSVMPVRDAISRLEENGLATRAPHRGAIVRDFTLGELIDMYNVRMILEVEAARLGAAAVTDANLMVMHEALVEMKIRLSEGRVIDAMAANSRMLGVLYAASGNLILVEMIDNLWKRCHFYRVMASKAAQDSHDDELWRQEPLIFEAARRHDPEAAAAAVQKSLNAARWRLELHLSTSSSEQTLNSRAHPHLPGGTS